MYTEIVKIIEGGLNQDPKKVQSYAKLLAKKMQEDGNDKFAIKINNVIKNIKGTPVYKDELFTAPVDNETRLNIANISLPTDINLNIKLSESTETSIREFVQMVNAKDKINSLGFDMHSSILLYGPPGCGKTSIAQHIARELDLPLVTARFDSLISSLLGSTSKNIRKLFDYCNSRPCILFLDEFDAIAKARDDSHELGELKRVINSLLQNIDDFTQNNILIAATNHENLLDKAIWRRFEKVIEISKPRTSEILDLVTLFVSGFENDFGHDSKKLNIFATELDGLSHSEIKKIIRNTAAKSIIKGNSKVGFESILLETFLYKNNNSYDLDRVVKYLYANSIPQSLIKDTLNVSIRQVRNILNP
ncbi:MAG: AAA family ATPase [Labilibaculum antarcticum]